MTNRERLLKLREAGAGIEPANSGFADRDLTTWLPRLLARADNIVIAALVSSAERREIAISAANPSGSQSVQPRAYRGATVKRHTQRGSVRVANGWCTVQASSGSGPSDSAGAARVLAAPRRNAGIRQPSASRK